ncbi:MAG TPA: hypothetical protein VIK62_06440 [Verrucomicrobiae bacterium]
MTAPFGHSRHSNKRRLKQPSLVWNQAFGRPHLHSGIGLRAFGKYFEFRAGLELRILFLAEGGDLHLCFVGNHNQVRAFIKNH